MLGTQVASVAATPTYIVQALRKGSFSIRGLSRYKYVALRTALVAYTAS